MMAWHSSVIILMYVKWHNHPSMHACIIHPFLHLLLAARAAVLLLPPLTTVD